MTDAEAAQRRKWLALALLATTQFVIVLDVAIVNVAIPSIGNDLDFAPENLTWIPNAYALTFGGFLLLGGRMADLLGRRRLFMGGLVLFAIASLLGGLATSETQLIICARGAGPRRRDPRALRAVDGHEHVRRGRRAQQGARASGARCRARAARPACCSAAC